MSTAACSEGRASAARRTSGRRTSSAADLPDGHTGTSAFFLVTILAVVLYLAVSRRDQEVVPDAESPAAEWAA